MGSRTALTCLLLAASLACSSKQTNRVEQVGGAGGQGGASGGASGGGGQSGGAGQGGSGPSPGTLLWLKSFGDSADDFIDDIAVDSAGNTIICGTFAGVLDLGVVPALATAGQAVFMAKLDPSGTTMWAKMFEQVSLANAVVATNSKDEIVLAGSFNGSLELGSGAMTSKDIDIFLAKFAPDGTIIGGSKRFGLDASERALSVAIGDNDNIFLAGWHQVAQGTGINFGGGPLPVSESSDVFMARFNDLLDHEASAGFPGKESDVGSTITVSGNQVLVGGNYSGTSGFGTGNAAFNDAFVLGLDIDTPKPHEFVATWGNSTDHQPSPRTVFGAAGAIHVAGIARGQVPIHSFQVGTPGAWTPFLGALNPTNGIFTAANPLGSWSSGDLHVAAMPLSSELVLAASFEGSVDLSTEKFSADTRSLFVSRASASGQAIWADQLISTENADAGTDVNTLIAVKARAGAVVMVGELRNSLSAQGKTVTTNGAADIYIAKYAY